MRKNMKGITLVVLVITIVILLILAGISIQAINNTRLFANVKKAKEKSMEGQLKEEISLAIQSIQVEEISKGNGVTLETLAGGQLQKELKDITAELADGEINGKYKDYEYTIDSNFNVTINGSVITYSWDEIAEIAKAISNDTSITDDSETATVTVNGVEKTLNVGDTATLDGKKVRILGFNHDTLAQSYDSYGSAYNTAGISLEYLDFLTSTGMNSSNTNSGGWKDTKLRGTLNGTTYNSLSIKNNIKKVKKDYISTYNVASTQQTEDYLWLLSCGEIWDNGYGDDESSKINGTRGYAITTEGKQYKYYKMKLGSTKYNSSNNITKKPSVSNSNWWWLRSPDYHGSSGFCYVQSSGYCIYNYARYYVGVTPGFSI